MSMHGYLWSKPASNAFTPMRGGLLQRKCACGGSSAQLGECDECRKKRTSLRRHATTPDGPATAPSIVHEVLRSFGQPLEPNTRYFMESRFGHDFSQVRIHTDARAAESARGVNALAYTVGRDVVFGREQYAPNTSEGRRLLAHELTHVVQQGAVSLPPELRLSEPDELPERQADAVSRSVIAPGLRAIRSHGCESHVQRQMIGPGQRSEGASQAAEDDGAGPEEARKALVEEVGEDIVRQLEQGVIVSPEESEAGVVAARVSSGSSAPAISRRLATPTIQRAAPVIAAAVAAFLICAAGFFHYAMKKYGHRNDKWLHCYTSCKIATYCGGPLIGDVVALIVGGGKEIADLIMDLFGIPAGAELEDFIADVEGIACSFKLESCIDCCNKMRP